jgi:hypothetical protein
LNKGGGRQRVDALQAHADRSIAQLRWYPESLYSVRSATQTENDVYYMRHTKTLRHVPPRAWNIAGELPR